MDSGIRVDYARLVCHDTFSACRTLQVNGHSMQQRCADCECKSTVLDPRTVSKRIFFIKRSRCCDHNEYSVKILHAVRSAITAVAELLVTHTWT